MRVNEYGQVSRTEKEIIDLLYKNPELDIKSINVEDEATVDRFNQSARVCDFDVFLHTAQQINLSVEEFDRKNQSHWFIPEEYKEFDILSWLYDQCTTQEQKDRVSLELELFVKHGMYDLLVCLKYLVDIFREKNIVWGVGRGSSVASYCLYLLSVHKVDSIKYNLDIHEFLK